MPTDKSSIPAASSSATISAASTSFTSISAGLRRHRRQTTLDERWEKERAQGGGVITRQKGEKGLSVVSFCHSKNTSARGESCTLTQTALQNRRHLPSDECWEKGRVRGGAWGGGL